MTIKFQHTVFDGSDQDSLEYSELLQSSELSSLTSSHIQCNHGNAITTGNIKGISQVKESDKSSMETNSETKEMPESDDKSNEHKHNIETGSLSSSSSLSILSPNTSLEHNNQGFQHEWEECCSLKKEEEVSIV